VEAAQRAGYSYHFLFRSFELHRFEYIAIPAEPEIRRIRLRWKLPAISTQVSVFRRAKVGGRADGSQLTAEGCER